MVGAKVKRISHCTLLLCNIETGRIITGAEAEKIGLVTRCVNDPMEEAMKVAKEIVER